MLLVSADLSDEKNRIQDEAGNDQSEKDNTENQQNDFPQVEQYSADIQSNCQCREGDAEYQEEDCCFTPPHGSTENVKRKAENENPSVHSPPPVFRFAYVPTPLFSLAVVLPF